MLVTCKCLNCGNGIEFETQQLGDAKFRVVNCPHCGKETALTVPESSEAPPAPPQASYVQPPPTPPPQTIYVQEKPKTGCLTKIIAAFLIIGLILFCISLLDDSNNISPPPASSEESSHKTVNADITHNDSTITVKNEDSFDWPELDVYLNGQPPFSYSARIKALKSGESVTYDLNQFSKEDGQRFDPYAYRVTKIWIGGNGYDYVEYGN